MTVSDSAREAWEQFKQQQNQALIQEHGEDASLELASVLGISHRHVSAVKPADEALGSPTWRGRLLLTVEDVQVLALPLRIENVSREYAFHAVGRCEVCGEAVAVGPVESLATLGRALEEGEPVSHQCAALRAIRAAVDATATTPGGYL